MTSNPFLPLAGVVQGQTRVLESLGVPYTDLFNESAIISDVNDPLKLGRVKVTTSDGFSSDYIPIYGSNSGTLSARYIGTEVVVGKLNGRSEDMFVMGAVKSNPDTGISGLPVQLPIVDESTALWNQSTDAGMICNEANKGRQYILSNEMNQDVVVCLRKNNRQSGGKDIWAWKSLTNGIWIEKGFNPGNSSSPVVTQSQLNNPGIPECNESMLGEIHEFSEDRGFRTTTMICRRGQNKNYTWIPYGSPGIYYRTTLPKCDENLHGMEAILDDGINSEFLVCQRYQGLMRWVRQGKRIPQKFYKKDLPLSRVDFLLSYKDIPALSESTEKPQSYDWVKNEEIAKVAIDAILSKIPPTGTDENLKLLLQATSYIPNSAFDQAATLKTVAAASLESKTGIPVDEIVDAVVVEVSKTNDISPETKEILSLVGDAGDALVNGVKSGTVDEALTDIGLKVTKVALQSVSPELASVVTGYATNGIVGAVDTAVAIGLDQLPPEVNKYVKPVVGIAKDLLFSEYPASVENILNSASGGGLLTAVSDTLNSALKTNLVTPQLLEDVTTSLTNGSLGEIPQLFNSFKNLDSISKLFSGDTDLPTLATTALSLLGQAGELSKLLGNGGIGFESFESLTGLSPVKLLLEGIKSLQGLFGSKNTDDRCPCGKNCREIKSAEDSDGNNLLEKCGSVTSNNATSYGSIENNNFNDVAKSLGISPTSVGKSLLPSPPNFRPEVVSYLEGQKLSTLAPVNLTAAINEVDRIGDMSKQTFDARYADWEDYSLEIAHTHEATQIAFKITDNNITRLESGFAKIIRSLENTVTNLMTGGEDSVAAITQIASAVIDVSNAVGDLFNYVNALDSVKNGGSAGVAITSNISKTLSNPQTLLDVNQSVLDTGLDIINKGVTTAKLELESLTPTGEIPPVLGEYPKTFPSPFPKIEQYFTEPEVLALSAKAKEDQQLPDSETNPLTNLLAEGVSQGLGDTLDEVSQRKGECDCEQV